tara:strand:+ start:684 stop:1670 length:987 start_codon:yes stop_codon:yes gene_type:complete
MKFIDQVEINIKAGNGGKGCIAFLREKFRSKGGPCGGNGGRGGSIIFKVDANLSTLQDMNITKHYKASNGKHGLGKNMHGKKGNDIIIFTPPGTIIKDFNTKQILCDLTEKNDEYIGAKGGNGGFGNAHFKTQTQVAPQFANDGQAGEQKYLELELKVLADVGLVGFPNAGKSTYISKISNAKPKIGDYPFTTLTPNLGIVKYSEHKSYVIADIPGLVKGASSGKGLGINFLKHIERTKVLVYLVDSSTKDIFKELQILKKEIKKYNRDLLNKPEFLLITKCDMLNGEKIDVSDLVSIDYLKVSALTGENIKQSSIKIGKLVQLQVNN